MTIIKGESLSIAIVINNYDKTRIVESRLYIGSVWYPLVEEDNMLVCRLTSQQTDSRGIGRHHISLWLDDTILGVRKPELGDIIVMPTGALKNTESTSSLYNIVYTLDIIEDEITVDDVLYNYVKGETGNGIASITLLSTVDKVKTYRITYTDETTFDYEVTDGADGVNGADGKTAYQSAVDGGYTGTEEQFNADLSIVSSKQDAIPFVETTQNKFLRDDEQFVEIISAGGASNIPVYMSDTNSDISGYKKLVYNADVGEITKTITANNNTVSGEAYLSDSAIGISTIPAGTWEFGYWRAVSNTANGSYKQVEIFVRNPDGSETSVVTFESSSIEDTVLTERLISRTSSLPVAVNPLGRLGVRSKFRTTRQSNTTLSYIIGDGRGWWMKAPIAIRHSNLRDKNGELAYQHIDQTTEKTTPIDADSVTIWDSVALKFVRTTLSHFKTLLANTFESLTNKTGDIAGNSTSTTKYPTIKGVFDELNRTVVFSISPYLNTIIKEMYLNVTKNAGDVFFVSWLNYANGIITTFTIKKRDINNVETTVLNVNNITASGLYLHRYSNGSTVLFNLSAYVSAINTSVNLNDNIFIKSLSPISNLQLNTNIADELNYKSIYNLGKNNILYSAPIDIDLSSIVEQGSFEYGVKTTSTTRIRTDFKEINFYSKYVMSCASGYLFQLNILDSLKNVISSSSFVNSLYADINGKNIIIVIKKIDDSSISVSDFASVSFVVKQYTGSMLPITSNKRISENDYINKLFKGLYINKENYDSTKRYYIQWFNYVGGVITTFNIYKSNYDGSNAALLVSGSGDTVSGITYIRKTGLVAIIDLNEFVSVVNYNVELNPCVFDKTTNADIQNLIDGNVSVQLSNLMIDSSAATFGRILRQKLNDEVFIMPFISDIHAIENYTSNYYYRSFAWLYAKFLSQLSVNNRCNAFAILGDTGIDEPTYLYKIMMEYSSCVQLDIPFHFALGNHEYVYTGTTGSINDVAFYNAFRKYTYSKFNMNTSESTRYCEFYDDIATGIRVITINTYLGASVYIPYLVNALSTLSAGQIAVILQHEPPYTELSALPNISTTYAEERSILSAFVAKQSGTSTNSTYDFTENTGKLAVMLCGHVHATIYDTISGVNVFASSGLGQYDASYVPTGKGRNEKLILGVHAFGEVLTVNKTTSKVKIFRIGKNDYNGSVDVEFSF